MNQRIKELWSRAGGIYDGGNQHTWPHYIIDDPEKFAELIIKETLQVAKAGVEFGPSMEEAVHEYFGVNNEYYT